MMEVGPTIIEEKAGMQVKTILSRVQKFKSFVYSTARWAGDESQPVLEVEVVERGQWPGAVFGVWSPSAGLRSACGSAF